MQSSLTARCVLTIAALTFAVGCTRSASLHEAPIRDGEAEAFADRILESWLAGSVDSLEGMFDFEEMGRRTCAGLSLVGPIRDKAASGVVKALRGGLLPKMVSMIDQGSDLEFLRVVRQGGDVHLIYRLITSETEAFDYRALTIARRGPHGLKVIEVTSSSAGLSASEILRSTAKMMAQEAAGAVPGLTGRDREMFEGMKQFAEVTRFIQAGEPRRALSLIEALPMAFRSDWIAIQTRLQTARELGEPEYFEALEACRKLDPRVAKVEILESAYQVFKGNTRLALDCIDRLEARVGGDPYLDTVRSEIVFRAGDPRRATALAEKAIDAAPDRAYGYWAVVGICLRTKDHGRALATLNQLEERFGLTISNLAAIPLYDDFTRSPEYVEWIFRHPFAGGPAWAEPADEGDNLSL